MPPHIVKRDIGCKDNGQKPYFSYCSKRGWSLLSSKTAIYISVKGRGLVGRSRGDNREGVGSGVWKLGILINIYEGRSRKELHNMLMMGMGLNIDRRVCRIRGREGV